MPESAATATSIRQIADVMVHAGVLYRPEVYRLARQGKLLRNGSRVLATEQLDEGDSLQAGNQFWTVIRGGHDRMQLQLDSQRCALPHPQNLRLHAGYHKCLTMFSRKVYKRACIASAPRKALAGKPWRFRHFYHRADAWQLMASRYQISSLSGHAINLDAFPGIRVVRFIRDPRDLLISSYHYHKRGAERWCHYPDPTERDWQVVGGCVPRGMRPGESLVDFLNRVDLDTGLQAEVEFRRAHFESMLAWPENDPRVKLYRFEDILGNEIEVFDDIARFFELAPESHTACRYFAKRYRAGGKEVKKDHIRDSSQQQWKSKLPEAAARQVSEACEPLLERYGYPPAG